MLNKKISAVSFFIVILLLSACQSLGLIEPTPTAVPPTPTPVPPTELTVCMGYEPQSLYPYAASSQAARDILQAIYDGPFDEVNGETIPVILESMPSYADGSASFTPISVKEGDQVVNIYGQLISLSDGAQVFPSGCTSPSCAVTWDGTSALQMDQPSATWRLISGLSWSDGQPLTAADSVYSFNLAADADTPVDKTYVDRTASYSAVDESTLQWAGKPGSVTDAFEHYFWLPLPQHAWGAYTAAELFASEEATRKPLGWGAYVVDEWLSEQYIRLKKNPFYFRADEGLPKYDYLKIEFLENTESSNILQNAAGRCDIVADSLMDITQIKTASEGISESEFELLINETSEFEFIAFGIKPTSYDDTYYPYGTDRPDLFGDVRTRQAFAYCIDRQGILDELTGNLVSASDAYLSKDNVLFSGASLTQYTYDPASGIALLNQVGWKDFDLNPATPLTMISTSTTVPYGTTFSIVLHTSEAPLRVAIAEKIASNLADCGIQVSVVQQPLKDLYLPGPDGVLFGRKFDLALLSWDTGSNPHCELFTSAEIPTQANYWLGEITGGSNLFGYSNTNYDQACNTSRSAGLDATAYISANQSVLQILSSDLPFIPLYHHPTAILVKKGLCFTDDLTSMDKILSSVETLDPNIICE